MKEKGLSINKYAEAVQKGEIMMPSPPQPPPPRPLNHLGIYSPVAAPPSGPPPPLPPMEEPIFVEEDSDEVCLYECVDGCDGVCGVPHVCLCLFGVWAFFSSGRCWVEAVLTVGKQASHGERQTGQSSAQTWHGWVGWGSNQSSAVCVFFLPCVCVCAEGRWRRPPRRRRPAHYGDGHGRRPAGRTEATRRLAQR